MKLPFLLLGLVGAGSQKISSAVRFPSFVAHDLNGRQVVVPRDAPTELTLVVVAFQRWHQADVDRWLRSAAPLLAQHPELDYLELPVLRRFNRVTRWWIDQGMRSGIPGQDQRARVVTLYTDKQAFRKRAGIAGEEAIHLFLIQRDGEILWRERGGVTPVALATLERAIRIHAGSDSQEASSAAWPASSGD